MIISYHMQLSPPGQTAGSAALSRRCPGSSAYDIQSVCYAHVYVRARGSPRNSLAGSPGVEPHCESKGAGFSGPYRLCRICSPLSPRPQVGESVLLKAARVAGVNKSGTASPATGVEPRLPTWGAGGSPPGSRGAEGVELWLPRGVEPGILGWSRAGLGSPWGARLHPKMPGSTGSTPGEPRRLRGAAAPFGEPRLPTEGSRPEFLGERGRWAAADEAPLRG